MFSKYHYLNHDFHKAARFFICTINGIIAGLCATLHLISKKRIMNGHRLVILPDFQGIGICRILTNQVGEILKQEQKRFVFTTTNPALIFSMKADKNWICKRMGRSSRQSMKHLKKSSSINRLSTSWEYLQ